MSCSKAARSPAMARFRVCVDDPSTSEASSASLSETPIFNTSSSGRIFTNLYSSRRRNVEAILTGSERIRYRRLPPGPEAAAQTQAIARPPLRQLLEYCLESLRLENRSPEPAPGFTTRYRTRPAELVPRP